MFREKYPHGSIITEEICVDLDKGYARYKAHVGDGEGGMATGYGTETIKDFADFAGRAETRAVGRALALLGFGTQFVGTDLTEGEHVADAPVAPLNGQQVLSSSELVSPHPLPEGEPPAPDPVDWHLTVEEVNRLVECALAANNTMEAFGADMRRLMNLPETQKITKKFLRERMTMAQYDKARAHYGQTLAQILEEDVPNFPSGSASDAEPLASSPTAGEDPEAEAKAKLRAEVATWALPVAPEEIEYILTHYTPEKARALLWGARRPKPAAMPIEAAAD
jgi:hypothetical protein